MLDKLEVEKKFRATREQQMKKRLKKGLSETPREKAHELLETTGYGYLKFHEAHEIVDMVYDFIEKGKLV